MCSILHPSLQKDSYGNNVLCVDLYLAPKFIWWADLCLKGLTRVGDWSPIRSPEIFLILSPVSGDEKKRRNDKLTQHFMFISSVILQNDHFRWPFNLYKPNDVSCNADKKFFVSLYVWGDVERVSYRGVGNVWPLKQFYCRSTLNDLAGSACGCIGW